jgi:hypothetical protein
VDVVGTVRRCADLDAPALWSNVAAAMGGAFLTLS